MTTTRAAIYTRVSTLEQATEDATSLANQEKRARNFAKSQGWEVVRVFQDPGVSGKDSLSEREGGAELMAAAQRGEFERAIFLKIDRFGRATMKGLADYDALESLGVGLVFVTEIIDTATPAGRLFRTILLAFAEFEREQIAERMSAGILGKAAQDLWPSGNPPYGYRAVGGVIETNGDEAEAVALIFALAARGELPGRIADALNARGFKTQRGGRFLHTTITNALRREVYKGEPYVWADPDTGDEVGLVPFPSIVLPEVWDAANREAKNRRTSYAKSQPESKRLYALAGRVYHAHGEPTESEQWVPMSGKPKSRTYTRADGSKRTTAEVLMYSCKRNTPSYSVPCPGIGETPAEKRPRKSIQAGEVEAAILLLGLRMLDDPERLAEFVAQHDRETLGALDGADAVAKAAQVVAELTKRRMAVLGLVTSGDYSEDEAREQVAALNKDLAEAERVIADNRDTVAASEALRLSVEVLRSAEIRVPSPVDVDDVGDNRDGSDWSAVRSYLEGEARRVLAVVSKPGRPSKNTEADPRNLERPAAVWLRELVTRFDLSVIVSDHSLGGVRLEGSIPAALGLGFIGSYRQSPSTG